MPAPSKICRAGLAEILVVCHNLREACQRDVRSQAGDVDPETLAIDRFQASVRAWAFMGDDDMPFAVAGLEQDRPGVVTWWMLTTPAVEKQARILAKFGRNAVSALFASGEVHRVQAFVLADWVQARRLVEIIGLRHEATMIASGIGKEDIAIFAATYGRSH